MPRSMVGGISAALVTSAVLLGLVQAQEAGKPPAPPPGATKRAEEAIEVATGFVRALFAADMQRVLKVTGLPFSCDGKGPLLTSAELERRIRGTKPFTGEDGVELGAVVVGKARVVEDVQAVKPPCVPLDYLIVEVSTRDGERAGVIKVCVRPGSPYQVIGFKD